MHAIVDIGDYNWSPNGSAAEVRDGVDPAVLFSDMPDLEYSRLLAEVSNATGSAMTTLYEAWKTGESVRVCLTSFTCLMP